MRNPVNYAPYFGIFLCAVFFSCATKQYFATPNYFTRQTGTLLLRNGETLQGDISVNNLLGNTVQIRLHDNYSTRKFAISEIRACRLNIGVFEPVIIKTEAFNLSSRPEFMERLTPDSFQLHLYEGYEKITDDTRTGDVSPGPGAEYNLEYYVHLPGDPDGEVWKLSTPITATHLSEGLNKLFSQCPELNNKIKSGDPAYHIYFGPQVQVGDVTVGRLSIKAKQEKVKQIIRVFREYDSCR